MMTPVSDAKGMAGCGPNQDSPFVHEIVGEAKLEAYGQISPASGANHPDIDAIFVSC